MPSYTNYRWEPSNKRKGNRYHYKRNVVWNQLWKSDEEQVIATVTYDDSTHSPYWGKWHVNFGAQSPELARLRMQEIPKFANKDDAIAWATAMIRLEAI
jgi:hypothetical protein